MEFIKKFGRYISSYYFYILILLYLLTRLINLMSMPIFNDEAIYIDWANKIRIGVVPLFYSLYDGKPPLHFLLISFMQNFVSDPLLAGRLLSVITGFLTILGIKKISDIIFGEGKYFIPVLIYIFLPMFLFYDRQSMQESLLTAEVCWILYFSISFFKNYKITDAVLLAFVLEAAFWTKISVLTITFPILTIFTYKIFKEKKRVNELFISSLLIFILLLILSVPLFSQSNSSLMFSRNDRYTITLSDINIRIIFLWLQNLIKTLKVYFWYFSASIIYIAWGVYYSFKKNNLKYFSYILLFLLPVFVLILSSKGIIDRYIIPFSLPLIFLLAYGFFLMLKKFGYIAYLLITPILLMSAFQIFNIDGYLKTLNKYAKGLDLYTYTGGFTSGYGVMDAIKFVKDMGAGFKKVYIGVRVDAGNPESAVMAYFLNKNSNSKYIPIYFDSQFTRIPPDDNFVGNYYPMYYISREDNLGGMNQYLEEITRFYKPEVKSFVGVYKYIKGN